MQTGSFGLLIYR